MLRRHGTKICREHYGMPKDNYYFAGGLERPRMRSRAMKVLGGFLMWVTLVHPEWLRDEELNG